MRCEICKTKPATLFAKFPVSMFSVTCGTCARRSIYHVPIDEYFSSPEEQADWNEHLSGRDGYLQFKAAVQRYRYRAAAEAAR